MGGRIAEGLRTLSAKLGPYGALILMLTLGITIAVALTAMAAEVYENVAHEDGVASFDRPALELAVSLRTPWLNAGLTGYTDIAGKVGMPLVAVGTLIALTFTRKSWTPLILIAAAGGGSLLMTVTAKALIGRERPPLVDAVPPYEYSGSFPSGHTLNAVVIAGVIAYLLILRQRTTRAKILTISVAVTFAFTTGLTRVYLGHHWFTDVLGAWMLGAAWLALVITAHRVYLALRRAGEKDLTGSPRPVGKETHLA
jgi:membrane-associated phospholipid phosphatase